MRGSPPRAFFARCEDDHQERWRQVLEEANRIERKHLITLEPAVSVDYTKRHA